MPSPLGHALAGVAAGWAVAGAPRLPDQRVRAWKEAALFGSLAMLPDIDLLFSGHRGPTHSIGAALIVGAFAWLVGTLNRDGPRGHSRLRVPGWLAVACMAAYGSHVPLDWLSHDNTPPIGIMALWPFSHDYYASQVQLFLAISRRYYHGWRFVMQNGLAVARELAILIPTVALVIVMRRRHPDALS